MKITDQINGWARQKVAGWLFRASPENPATSLSNPDSWLFDLFGGQKTAAGIRMNEETALTVGAVYTAVRIISNSIGALPLHVYRRDETGKRSFAVRHWAYPLLHDSPNEYHTSTIWMRMMMAHLLLWGNAYNRIEWVGNGSARNLLPLMPWAVTPRRTPTGLQVYDVQLADGSKETLPGDEVLHIPGLMYDGIQGISVIGAMRDSAALAKVAEQFGSSFFANGARPGIVLEVPGKMKEGAQQTLAKSVMAGFSGPSNAFKAMVLEEGAKLHNVQMPMQDAQFLETRRFQRSEILGWYGIPPHLGGDTERSTSWGTGIEQQDIGFAKHTIAPWCVAIEQELNRKLFGRGSGLYAKFNLDGLMRGDFKSRMEGYRIAVGAPFLSRNEARELEDWNTMSDDGMDTVITPLNMGVGAKPEPAEPANHDNNTEPAGEPSSNARSEHRFVNRVDMPTPNITIENRMFEQQAPIVNVQPPEVRVEAPVVHVHNTVSPATPEVRVDVQVPEAPRPIINVENRVEQAPVEVNVHLPDRKTVSEVERDPKTKEIVRVTQRETDA